MISEICDSRKGVTSPEHNRSKQRVNEQLIKIKEKLLFDETPETELSFEYTSTQPIRPQQFFAEIDGKLDGLNRDDYIKELLHICHKDTKCPNRRQQHTRFIPKNPRNSK